MCQPDISDEGRNVTYYAVPHSSVIPEGDILLLVGMGVDVFRRQNRSHDPENRL